MPTALGTDEENPPTGTLTINLVYIDNSVVQVDDNNVGYGVIGEVLLSTPDKLVDTGDELNAKLYKYEPHPSGDTEIIQVTIGENYIDGVIDKLPMVEAPTGEQAVLSGSFTALSSN